MLSRTGLRTLFRDAAVYGVVSAASRAISLISFPMLARGLSVVEYGRLDYFFSMSAAAGTFFIMGLDSGVARFAFDDKYKTDGRRLLSAAVVAQFAIIVGSIPVIAVFALRSERGSGDAPSLLLLALLQAPALVLINASQNVSKWSSATRAFVVSALGLAGAQFLVNIYMVHTPGCGATDIAVANCAVSCCFAAVAVASLRAWFARPTMSPPFGAMVRYSLSYGVLGFLGAMSAPIERSIVTEAVGANSLGLYAVGIKFAAVLNMVNTAFQTAWGPYALRVMNRPEQQNFDHIANVFACVMAIGVVWLHALAPTLVEAVSDVRYQGAVVLVLPLCLSVAVQSVGSLFETGLSFALRGQYLILSYVAYFGAFGLASAMLVPLLALAGLGWAVLAASVARTVVVAGLSRKVYPIDWEFSAVGRALVLALVGGLVIARAAAPHEGSIRAAIALLTSVVLAAMSRKSAVVLRAQP